jgi:hypothetical protein
MAEERKLRQTLGARPIGKRGRGCPRETWEDVVEELGREGKNYERNGQVGKG